VEKLLSVDNIKVTKGLGECLRGRAYVASQVGLGRDLVIGKRYSCVKCFKNVN
jgi:hypothetical protein